MARGTAWIELNEATRRVDFHPTLFGWRVTLSYNDGEWTAQVRQGLRVLLPRQKAPAKTVLNGLDQLGIPALREAVGATVGRDRLRVQAEEEQLWERIRTKESTIADITSALDRSPLP